MLRNKKHAVILIVVLMMLAIVLGMIGLLSMLNAHAATTQPVQCRCSEKGDE